MTNKDATSKSRLHPRNKNREKYDLSALVKRNPALQKYIIPSKSGGETINFTDPVAVKLLNTALLSLYYKIDYWEFPDDNLCPPIPGRADYIHHMADLLQDHTKDVTCLDIGTGASLIYPVIGVTEYDWNFIASDIDEKSIASAQKIIDNNSILRHKINLRLQHRPKQIFNGILSKKALVDAVICNPPFHSSFEEARKGSMRKVKNLTGKSSKNPKLNFSGNLNELVFEGGEYKFIHSMIRESEQFYKNVLWFSSIVSKESNLKGLYKTLRKFGAVDIRTIPMGTGNKSSRILAWSYFTPEEQKNWKTE